MSEPTKGTMGIHFSWKRRLSRLVAQRRAVSKPSRSSGQARSLSFDTPAATQPALALLPDRELNSPSKGTYALVLHLERSEEITVGRLGVFTFPAGYYLYVGSALGPGGLEARLARHRRRDKKLHWHIDYLLEHAQLVEVWSATSTDRLECLWAQAARHLPGAEIPVPGFGSSDCRCPSHLIYLARKPTYEEFAVLRGQHFKGEVEIAEDLGVYELS